MKADLKTIAIHDPIGKFVKEFKNDEQYRYLDLSVLDVKILKDSIMNDSYEGLLVIPNDTNSVSLQKNIQYISNDSPGVLFIEGLEQTIAKKITAQNFQKEGLDTLKINQAKADVTIKLNKSSGETALKGLNEIKIGIGGAFGYLIMMFIIIYGNMVMRSVIEEKTYRIIEIIISSVKPFQLMMGKIIGIGLVGLTQFTLWIVLSTTLVGTASKILLKDKVNTVKTELVEGKQNKAIAEASNNPALTVINAVKTLNLPYIFGCFLVYFLGGYMIYSALFAAVGSAVDNETETQQFMLPITLPLLFTYIMSFSFIINNPDSSLSFWLSIIPFTSPIAMMVRLPFGVPDWQLALSMVLLIGGFILTTYIAAKIYRVGILMYGKKASYKELAKWLFYKE
jgi:ABC-2 type transport system permease protein